MDVSDTLRHIKQQFFALRNGVVADALRKSGDPHPIIFGLNLPQIKEIAAAVERSDELAEALWNDAKVRESQLLAPFIWNVDNLSFDMATAIIAQVANCETADVLCQRLLRHFSGAEALSLHLINNNDVPLTRYIGLRLALNLLMRREYRDIASLELAIGNLEAASLPPASMLVIRQIRDELSDY